MQVQYLSSSLKRKYLVFFFLLGGKESPQISLNIQVSPPLEGGHTWGEHRVSAGRECLLHAGLTAPFFSCRETGPGCRHPSGGFTEEDTRRCHRPSVRTQCGRRATRLPLSRSHGNRLGDPLGFTEAAT